jgi:hypothetical protein
MCVFAVEQLVIADTCGFDSWMGPICLDRTIKYRTFVRTDDELNAVQSVLDKGTFCFIVSSKLSETLHNLHVELLYHLYFCPKVARKRLLKVDLPSMEYPRT